jgi:hypothetical protein
MRVATAITGLVGAVAGVAAGVLAYQSGAELPQSSDQTTPAVARPALVASTAPVVRARLADCKPPTRLQNGVCVRHVHRTVVVYDAPSAGGPAAPLGNGTEESYAATSSGQRTDAVTRGYEPEHGADSEHGGHEGHGHGAGDQEPEDD